MAVSNDQLARKIAALETKVAKLQAARPIRGSAGGKGAKGDPGPPGTPGNSSFVQEGEGAATRTLEDKARERLALNDFLPTGAPDDWRTALDKALTEARTKVGATIWLPRQLGAREIDNTGLGPIDISDLNNIAFEGEGDEPAELDIVTTDGTSLFRANSTITSLQKWWLDGIYINNLNTRPLSTSLGAGHIFEFAAKGMSKCFFGPRFRVWQRNPDYSIIIATVSGDGGFLEGTWEGEWEFGTTGANATVPAVKITTQGSLFGPIQFVPHRIHCHNARAPFLWVDNTSGGNWTHLITFAPQNVEGVRSGLVRGSGAKAWRFGGPIEMFDSQGLDRDLFEMRDGSGGQPNYACVFDQLVGHGAELLGVADEFQSVTSITQAAGTATVTKTAHGYNTGDLVDIVNSFTAGYNKDSIAIVVTDADHLTYAVSGGTATPAEGPTIKMRRTRHVSASISHVAGLATLSTAPFAHGLVVGQVISNLGWNQAGYNIRAVITEVPSSTSAKFEVDSGTATPGTGSGTWARASMHVALLGLDEGHSFVGCGGSQTTPLEIDAGGRDVAVVPMTRRMKLYRAGDESFIAGLGATSPTIVGELQVGQITSPTGGPFYAPFGIDAPPPEDWTTVTVTRDGPVQASGVQAAVPSTDLEWLKLGWPKPDSLWLLQEASGDLADSMPNSYELTVDGTVDYQQSVSGWTRKSVKLTGTASEALKIKPSANPYDPSARSVAVVLYFKIGTTSGGGRTMLTLGTPTAGAGSGGYMLRLNSAGNLVLRADGAETTGTYVYENDGLVHVAVVLLDHSREQIIVRTDVETLPPGVWTGIITNANTKGIGGPSGLTPPDAQDNLLLAWFWGSKAEQISAMGINAVATLGWIEEIPDPGPRALETGGIYGYRLTWTSNSQVTLSPGSARAHDDFLDIVSATSLVCDVSTSGVGGRLSGSETADTWYALWLIDDSTGGNIANIGCEANFTAPTLPAGYDKYRFIGAFRNNGSSNILHFRQFGNGVYRVYEWDEARSVLNILHKTGTTATSFTDVDLSPLVPPGCELVEMHAAFEPPAGGAATDVLEIRPKGANSSDGWQIGSGVVLAQLQQGWRFRQVCDANQDIQYRATDADDLVDLWVVGYEVFL